MGKGDGYFAVNIRNLSKPRAYKGYRDPLGDSGYSDGVYRGADGGGYVGAGDERIKSNSGEL